MYRDQWGYVSDLPGVNACLPSYALCVQSSRNPYVGRWVLREDQVPAFLLLSSLAGDAQVCSPRQLTLQCILAYYRFLCFFSSHRGKQLFPSLLIIIAVASSYFLEFLWSLRHFLEKVMTWDNRIFLMYWKQINSTLPGTLCCQPLDIGAMDM